MSDLSSVFGVGFDCNSVEPQSDFEVLPPGKYPVLIEKAEVKQTKKQDGHYIELTLSILDGPAKNRKIWDRINIQNPSQQCTEIGLRTLAALGQAIGVTAIADTAQLVNQVCIAHVKVDKDGQNSVRTYSACNAGLPTVTNPTPSYPLGTPDYANRTNAPVQSAAPTQQPTTTAVKPPWARGNNASA